MKGVCGCCYEEDVEVSKARCIHDPKDLKGAPIGMYHCPDCCAMILAGIEHPTLCEKCQPKEFDL